MRASTKPILAARRRRQLHPFFFRMGPVGLSICSVLLISLMAVLYLAQLGQAVTANQEIQRLHRQQATLAREDQDLAQQIAQEQSPVYIAARAKAMGLVPADPKTVIVLVISHLKPIPSDHQHLQP
jgi:cell division protein FtsB